MVRRRFLALVGTSASSPGTQRTEGWKPTVPIAPERSNNGPIGDRSQPNQITTEKNDA